MVRPLKIALFSMPWALFNRPSIQLGTLKSYLDKNSDYQTVTYHPYLSLAQKLGAELYYKISIDGWAGESVFASLLFPEKKADCKKLFSSSLKDKIKPLPDFENTVASAEKLLTDYLEKIVVTQYNLIGFSVCFSQLTSSLFIARKIKELSPETSVVLGGSSCSAILGESLMQYFSFIDYLIAGEGEHSLLELCDYRSGKRTDIPATVLAQTARTSVSQPEQLLDLNDLPPPDYTPFFDEMKKTFPGQPFIPVIPIEFSRGCWWNKCSFCNLNLQWRNYRRKSGGKMVRETLFLTKKHESLHFAFTDNALPPKEADHFFGKIVSQNIDFDFFAEIRSKASSERLKNYSRGCLKTAQVGIEALSSSLLQKMAKGTTVMDNIAVMKICCENNIQLEGNLIIEFPSTTEKEIAETLDTLDYVLPYTPLQIARFFLGHGSPMHKNPKDYGITAVLSHYKNRMLFPKKYVQSMSMLLNSYRGDKQYQRQIWQPVKDKVKTWQLCHKATDTKKLLSYRDGGTFLIIRQERFRSTPLQHRLRGISRKIYLFCQSPQTVEHIMDNFSAIKEHTLRSFLLEMSGKRLMFMENDRVLSLAVNTK